MLENLVRVAIVGVVLLVAWYIVDLLIAALGVPHIILTAVAVLLVLCWLLYAIRAFGVSL